MKFDHFGGVNNMVRKICCVHRYPEEEITGTNASFPYFIQMLKANNHEVTFIGYQKFDRTKDLLKLIKSFWFIFYAPYLIAKTRKQFDIIYCDDSFPFYPAMIKLFFPLSRVIHYLGDFHLMYYCSGIVYKIAHWLEILCWKKVDKIIVITPNMQKLVEKETGRKCPIVGESIDE